MLHVALCALQHAVRWDYAQGPVPARVRSPLDVMLFVSDTMFNSAFASLHKAGMLDFKVCAHCSRVPRVIDARADARHLTAPRGVQRITRGRVGARRIGPSQSVGAQVGRGSLPPSLVLLVEAGFAPALHGLGFTIQVSNVLCESRYIYTHRLVRRLGCCCVSATLGAQQGFGAARSEAHARECAGERAGCSAP